jgi:hypothetical protein
MAFGCDVCVWGLGGVWLGQETYITLGKFFLKIGLQLPHKLLVLLEKFVSMGQICDWKS